MAKKDSWNPPSVSDVQVDECWVDFVERATVTHDDKRIGLAIVFGITSHRGPKGVSEDCQKVVNTFDMLRFAVWTVENPTETELEKVLRAASTKRLPDSFKCIVVYYAGHGGCDREGGNFIVPEPLQGKPHPRYYVQKGIIAKFDRSRLYHLFFFDCCLSSPSEETATFFIPKDCLFLIAYATSWFATAGGTSAGGKWTQILMDNIIKNYDQPINAILDKTWEDLRKKESGNLITKPIQKPHHVASVGTFSLKDIECVVAAPAAPAVHDHSKSESSIQTCYDFGDIEHKRPSCPHLIAALEFMKNDEKKWKWFGVLLDPNMKGNWPYEWTLEHFIKDVYKRKPTLTWGDVRKAMRQPTEDGEGYPLTVEVDGQKKNCEDLLLEHMSDKLRLYVD